jgi:hypothetical protein
MIMQYGAVFIRRWNSNILHILSYWAGGFQDHVVGLSDVKKGKFSASAE